MLALGYGSRRLHLVEAEQFDACTSVVFRLIMPIHLFNSISKASIDEIFDPKLLLTVMISVLGIWIASMLVVPRIEKDHRKCSAIIQGFFRSNVILFGVRIADTLGGATAAGVVALISSIIVPTYNILAVITLEAFRGGKPNIKNMITGVLHNHLVLSSILGVLYLLSGWTMPAALKNVINDVARTATPLAIISLGGTFRFSALRSNAKQMLLVNVVKLFLAPLIVLAVSIALGLRGVSIIVLLCICATPVATTTFSMTQKMGGDGELAGQIVVSTCLFSVLTLFFWVFVLNNLGVC